MPLQIVTVPCLKDNYAYLVNDGRTTCVIDAPEAAPIEAVLDARGWGLDTILITHHHHDHVGGAAALQKRFGARLEGPRAERAKLPALAREYAEGDIGGEGESAFTVLEVPGHTLGHIAYHFDKADTVFTADSLMALGCGRLFEGSADMMWASLSKLAALPPDTTVCSGHEYTSSNAAFALTIDPDNPALQDRARRIETARAAGEPTAQVRMSEELATNPFLRAADPAIRDRLGMTDARDSEVFAEIRARKDRF